MSDAELPADLAQIALASGLVLHDRSATDYFQIRNSCEAGENLVLDAHRKISIRLIVAQVVARKHRDTFLEWSRGDFGRLRELRMGDPVFLLDGPRMLTKRSH